MRVKTDFFLKGQNVTARPEASYTSGIELAKRNLRPDYLAYLTSLRHRAKKSFMLMRHVGCTNWHNVGEQDAR